MINNQYDIYLLLIVLMEMMNHVKIEDNINEFKTLINNLSKYFGYCTLRFNEKYISCLMIDSIQDILIYFRLDKSAFTEFIINEPVLVDIDLIELNTNLNIWNVDSVVFDITENFCDITIISGKKKLQYTDISPKQEDFPFEKPEIGFNLLIRMESHRLIELFNISDVVEIEYHENKLKWNYLHETIIQTDVDISVANDLPISIKNKYSTTKILLFEDIIRLSDNIEVYMTDDFPLVTRTNLNIGKIFFLMSPIQDKFDNIPTEIEI